MIEFPAWPAPLSSAVSAEILLPGSKSLTNRELVLSALAQEPTELISPLVSRDSELMIASLKALGTEFSWQGSDLLVTPGKLSGPAEIDCGLAGTVMRFVPPLSMLVDGEVSFDGDAGARARPDENHNRINASVRVLKSLPRPTHCRSPSMQPARSLVVP